MGELVEQLQGWALEARADPHGAVLQFLDGAVVQPASGSERVHLLIRAMRNGNVLADDAEVVESGLRAAAADILDGLRESPTNRNLLERAVELFRLVEVGRMDSVADVLRDQYSWASEGLGLTTTGSAWDPLASYLRALARTQVDDSLALTWWLLASLSGSQPAHRGEIGVYGVEHMPADSSQSGVLRPSLVAALLAYGRALVELPPPDPRSSPVAARFVLLCRRLEARYPFPDTWTTIINEFDDASRVPEQWLRRGFAQQLDLRSSSGTAFDGLPHFDSSWPSRGRRVARSLRSGDRDCIRDAEVLLAEQRWYFTESGDASPYVKALSNFSTSALRRFPSQSIDWSARALQTQPSDIVVWLVRIKSLIESRQLGDALDLALAAVERFPGESSALNQLGHVLMRARELDLAEAVYEVSLRRFPDDPHSQGGAAEVRKHKHDLAGSEALYREGLHRFPGNEVLVAGLAAVLRLAGPTRWEEAKSLLEGLETSEANRERRRLREAEAEGGASGEDDREGPRVVWQNSPWIRLRLASLLRHRQGHAGIDRARTLLAGIDETQVSGALRARLAAETVLLNVAEGEVQAAVDLAADASREFPGSPIVLFGEAVARMHLDRESNSRYSQQRAAQIRSVTQTIEFLTPRAALGARLLAVQSLSCLHDGSALQSDFGAEQSQVLALLDRDSAVGSAESWARGQVVARLGGIERFRSLRLADLSEGDHDVLEVVEEALILQ